MSQQEELSATASLFDRDLKKVSRDWETAGAPAIRCGFEAEFASKEEHATIADRLSAIVAVPRSSIIVSTRYGVSHGTAYKYWSVESDGSIPTTQQYPHQVELVSPIMTLPVMLQEIPRVFKLIQDYGHTYSNTGLHLSFSLDDYDLRNINIVKLVMLLGEHYWANAFGRENASYAKLLDGYLDPMFSQLFDESISKNKGATESSHSVLSSIKKMTLAQFSNHVTKSERQLSINPLNALNTDKDMRRIEFRLPGGEGYEYKADLVVRVAQRFAYAMYASQNDLYDDVYHARLYRRYRKWYEKHVQAAELEAEGSILLKPSSDGSSIVLMTRDPSQKIGRDAIVVSSESLGFPVLSRNVSVFEPIHLDRVKKLGARLREGVTINRRPFVLADSVGSFVELPVTDAETYLGGFIHASSAIAILSFFGITKDHYSSVLWSLLHKYSKPTPSAVLKFYILAEAARGEAGYDLADLFPWTEREDRIHYASIIESYLAYDGFRPGSDFYNVFMVLPGESLTPGALIDASVTTRLSSIFNSRDTKSHVSNFPVDPRFYPVALATAVLSRGRPSTALAAVRVLRSAGENRAPDLYDPHFPLDVIAFLRNNDGKVPSIAITYVFDALKGIPLQSLVAIKDYLVERLANADEVALPSLSQSSFFHMLLTADDWAKLGSPQEPLTTLDALIDATKEDFISREQFISALSDPRVQNELNSRVGTLDYDDISRLVHLNGTLRLGGETTLIDSLVQSNPVAACVVFSSLISVSSDDTNEYGGRDTEGIARAGSLWASYKPDELRQIVLQACKRPELLKKPLFSFVSPMARGSYTVWLLVRKITNVIDALPQHARLITSILFGQEGVVLLRALVQSGILIRLSLFDVMSALAALDEADTDVRESGMFSGSSYPLIDALYGFVMSRYNMDESDTETANKYAQVVQTLRTIDYEPASVSDSIPSRAHVSSPWVYQHRISEDEDVPAGNTIGLSGVLDLLQLDDASFAEYLSPGTEKYNDLVSALTSLNEQDSNRLASSLYSDGVQNSNKRAILATIIISYSVAVSDAAPAIRNRHLLNALLPVPEFITSLMHFLVTLSSPMRRGGPTSIHGGFGYNADDFFYVLLNPSTAVPSSIGDREYTADRHPFTALSYTGMLAENLATTKPEILLSVRSVLYYKNLLHAGILEGDSASAYKVWGHFVDRLRSVSDRVQRPLLSSGVIYPLIVALGKYADVPRTQIDNVLDDLAG